MRLIAALLITLLSEGIVMYAMTRSMEWLRYNAYCNLVTNPILNLSIWALFSLCGVSNLTPSIIVGEAFVLFSEAVFYRLMSRETFLKCLLLSLATNAVSYTTGLIISTL